LAAFPRSASVLAIGWHDIRPGRRGRVGRDAGAASAAAPMSASGRRGRAGTARRIPASGVRTQHGPAL